MDSPPNGIPSRLVAAVSYLLIVLVLWLPFNPRSGFPYETGFVYTSEVSAWWNGFLHGADVMRIYSAFFYQVAYLMGDLFGVPGSFVPYQIVYAALWWARGFLVFLIGRRLIVGQDLFWYLVGALVLVHSSDDTIGWAGQLNQFGYIFWTLAAFYMLVLAFEQTAGRRLRICLLAAAIFEHLSLWSYESQLVILLVAPLLLLRRYPPKRRWLSLAAACYAVPAIYIIVACLRYALSGGHTYQVSVLRKTWTAGSILSDWLFNISTSLRFWAWGGGKPVYATARQMEIPAALAAIAFLAGLFLIRNWIPDRRMLWRMMLAGGLLLVLSFPAYLILDMAHSRWRTQILSGLGFALAMSAVIGLCATCVRRAWLQRALVGFLGALIVVYGSYSAVKKAAYHRWVWERHRSAIARILQVAPRLTPKTLVILTNVPKDSSGDPFQGNDMWLDMALHLAYPSASVSGVYFYPDGAAAPGEDFRLAPNGNWTLHGDALPAHGNVTNVLVLDCNGQGSLSVAQNLPSFLRVDENAARMYAPQTRIQSGNPSPRAVRRYLAGNANATYAP